GDPDATSVVLWTRLTGDGLPDDVAVTWEVSTDEAFATVDAAGTTAAAAADGHSVHVTVALDGPTRYRFRAGGFTSPVGWAAPSPPPGTGELRLATASCQHWETGYYAAHRDLAEWRPDAVVFLGDFIYEGGSRPLGDGRVRSHEGAEPEDLTSYRGRYAQYLADRDLQAARAACPWLVIWDDHEVQDDYAGLEPKNPARREGFAAKRDAAYRAWWEHMPVRLPAPVAGEPYIAYRTVSLGALADVILLDGRQFRSDQACGDATFSLEPACAEAAVPDRTMLGADQEAWVGDELAAARAHWTVLGQQTVLADLRLPNGAVVNEDQWDGYAPARDRLLAQAATAERVVVLTGDIHLAAVARLPGVGTELVTTSISSNGRGGALEQTLLSLFPDVVGAELPHRGYTRHVVTVDDWTAEFRTVDDVANPDSTVSTWQTFRLDATMPDQPHGL
ncbi:MAG: alkaline phosphatase D family protein, partial [Ilumatobacteraceae bacterium]